MDKKELLGELADQIHDHGEDTVTFWLETDSGSGSLMLIDVKFEDNMIKVIFA